jgi:hypothetical protein
MVSTRAISLITRRELGMQAVRPDAPHPEKRTRDASSPPFGHLLPREKAITIVYKARNAYFDALANLVRTWSPDHVQS